jgi:aldose sugar dehydrogenase
MHTWCVMSRKTTPGPRISKWTRIAGLVAVVLGAAALRLYAGAGAQPPISAPPPEASGYEITRIAGGIEHPWGIDWLPDGRALITARGGTLHVIEGERIARVAMEGLPEVYTENQAGLFDVSVRANGTEAPWVYMTLATGDGEANRTALVRGVFEGGRVASIETLFRVQPDKQGGEHFGSRLLWLDDGTVLMSIGDGGNPPRRVGGMLAREQAQNRNSHLGSVLRLSADGKPAPGNPFLGKAEARDEIWSYGHRNIQGMARDPMTGRVFVNEHGPRGGDELNLVERGRNYGWPLQSYGVDYRTGEPIGQPTVQDTVEPLVVWTPATAPSGLAFYTGGRLAGWRGSLFSGGLVSEDVRRVELDRRGNVTRQERIKIGHRVRDVKQGPDGYLYVLTDEEDGRLLSIERKAAR